MSRADTDQKIKAAALVALAVALCAKTRMNGAPPPKRKKVKR